MEDFVILEIQSIASCSVRGRYMNADLTGIFATFSSFLAAVSFLAYVLSVSKGHVSVSTAVQRGRDCLQNVAVYQVGEMLRATEGSL